MNIERMFQLEVRDKKRTASGVYHRASRRGYIRGGVKTPSDYLSKREKNKLNGEVKVYNMFEKYTVIENVPQISEIEKMTKVEKVNLYRFLKKEYSNAVLQKHWKVSLTYLYSHIYKKYDLYEPRQPRDIGVPKIEGLYKNIAEVPSIKAVLEMTASQRKGVLIASREQFSTNALTQHWNVSKYKLYDLYNKNDIIKKNNTNNLKLDTTVNINETPIIVDDKNSVQAEISVIQQNKQDIDQNTLKTLVEEMYNNIKQEELNSKTVNNGFKIEMNGVYSKQELENKLLSLVNILNENKEYNISFNIEEM